MSRATPAPRIRHPHIWRRPGVCGGAPVIRGTRIAVRLVVDHGIRGGATPEEMLRAWPHLTLAQIYDALSYYYDHKKEIDRELRAEERALERLMRGA